jgi:hypothetical protein
VDSVLHVVVEGKAVGGADEPDAVPAEQREELGLAAPGSRVAPEVTTQAERG